MTESGGGAEPVPIGLEKNPGAVVELGAHNPPDVPLYMLRVGIRSGFGGAEACLPVLRYENTAPHPILKEIFNCEVAGKTLEAANVYALRDKVQRELEIIAPARQLPLAYFRAPRFDYALPVYEEGSRLVCPVLAGPKIKAESLAGLREPVLRYLRVAGYLEPDEEPDVQVLRPSDLRLVPPAAVIRCLDDAEMWLPTVEGSSPDGPVIGLLTHPAELNGSRRSGEAPEPPPAGTDVAALLRRIGQEMVRAGRLLNPWMLYATETRPEIWSRTEELTDPTSRYLACFLEGGEELRAPIRHTAAGEVVAALKERAISVFMAGDDDALCRTVGRYLTETGFIRHAEDLRVHSVREEPPERLDPDQIWTHGSESEDQEVTRT